MASIGLVLSGGIAKGAYQVGVLRALSEFVKNDNEVYISASSIGVLNAYAYATNKLKFAEDMWLNLKTNGRGSWLKLFKRSSCLFDAIDAMADGNEPIENYLYTACFNKTAFKLNYIDLHRVEPAKIKDYLKASISVPVQFNAVEISGNKYLDGAMIDNIPIFPLLKYHLDYIIVVHFDNSSYIFENQYLDNKLIEINFLDDRIII